jgi:hypothetical protein
MMTLFRTALSSISLVFLSLPAVFRISASLCSAAYHEYLVRIAHHVIGGRGEPYLGGAFLFLGQVNLRFHEFRLMNASMLDESSEKGIIEIHLLLLEDPDGDPLPSYVRRKFGKLESFPMNAED